MKACSTGQTETLRLMVPESSNQLMSQAGSGVKTDEDNLIILLTALFVMMLAHNLYVA